MAELIEPTHFDAVVISSGLPEVLIASALARAGKAVLVLDPEESYGSSWASLSGTDFVHQLLNKSVQAHRNDQQQTQAHAAAAHGVTAGQAERGDAAGSIAVQQQQQLAGVEGCSLYTHPSLEKALDNKGLIIDLAPRVLYQDEALVHLLVSCQAHNYLEFKLVEGNYVYLDGQLLPVPASRADLFADRALSLADKRSLGRFMAACVEAAEGSGRLKDSFDSRPLVDLLLSEGLNERLQQVVLYGIAMADTPQHTTQQPTQQQAEQTAAEEASAASNPPSQQQQQQQQQQQGALLTAADGLAAFALYSQSLGRFGGSGALMGPCYGSGSLTEAFVRLAAVKGAVTALRHATTHLQLLPDADADAAADSTTSPAAGQTGAQQQQPSLAPDMAAGDSEQQQQQKNSGAAAAPVGPVATALPRVRLALASGQTITAGCVVSSSSSSSTVPVARAVAVLDGSLVQGDTSLVFVIPPGTLGPWQTAVIRGLQLGHALSVAPPGHCLLYLSAVLTQQQDAQPSAAAAAGGAAVEGSSFSIKSAAEGMLGPALAAVAATQHLQQFAVADKQPADQSSSGQEDQQQQQQQEQSDQLEGAAPAAGQKPQVLAVSFYLTRQDMSQAADQQQQQQQQAGVQAGSCLVQCPQAPAAGFAGYTSSVSHAEVLFRQHFPGLPWLTDPQQQLQAQQPAAGGAAAEGAGDGGAANTTDGKAAAAAAAAAGSAAGGGIDDDELDAIDELTAALMELSSGLESMPGQGAGAATQL